MPGRRLALVDDLVIVSDAIAHGLSVSTDLVVTGRLQTSDPNLVAKIAALRPEVVVIDVAPAGAGAGGVVSALREGWPAAPIVVLTASTDIGLAAAAARAGALSWIEKTSPLRFLAEALDGAARGRAWWPPDLLGPVLDALRADADPSPARRQALPQLTDREQDVLAGLRAGRSQKELAQDLRISVHTVRSHTATLFGKLRVHSRAEALAVASDLDDPPEPGRAGSPTDAGDEVGHRDDPPRGDRS